MFRENFRGRTLGIWYLCSVDVFWFCFAYVFALLCGVVLPEVVWNSWGANFCFLVFCARSMLFGSVLPMYLLHCVVLFSRNLLEERLFFFVFFPGRPPFSVSLLSPHFFLSLPRPSSLLSSGPSVCLSVFPLGLGLPEEPLKGSISGQSVSQSVSQSELLLRRSERGVARLVILGGGMGGVARYPRDISKTP